MERFEVESTGYWHRQNAPTCWIFYTVAFVAIAIGSLFSSASIEFAIASSVGLAIVAIGAAFQYLTVDDQGDYLAVRFGPLPLFCRKVRYEDILQVEVGKTTILEGWGIHMSPRGGWVWNLWGFDCVVIQLRQGTLRIGTDDPEGLARFLHQKITSKTRTRPT